MRGGKIIQTLKNLFKAIVRGELFMSLHVDRYLPQIMFTFILFAIGIWMGINIESTLVQLDRTVETLKSKKVELAEKTVELASLYRISTMEEMLQRCGSDLGYPEERAREIGN